MQKTTNDLKVEFYDAMEMQEQIQIRIKDLANEISMRKKFEQMQASNQQAETIPEAEVVS